DILLITQEHFCNHQRITRNTVATFITLFKKRFKTQLYAFDPTDFKEPGHPVLVFQHENQKFKTILNKLQDKLDQNIIDENVKALFQSLNQMTNHYHRKEKLFFPILERYRHFTVTRIMWKGDDTLRNLYTATKRKFDRLPDIKIEVIRKAFDQLHTLYDDMIFQEETFLIPVVKKLFTRD